ncbi:MAG: hypothetical protein HY096_00300 [Nitrospinae bacterium]|nr:hypothetical protein [Nitrospinota bacterium]
MNLSELKKKDTNISGWVNFEGKFDVLINYLSKSELQTRFDRCKKTKYVKHQPQEDIDTDKLHLELAQCILDWKGLTLSTASKLIPIEIPAGQENADVPCTDKNKLTLMQEVYGFDIFIQQASTDLSSLKQEIERKN